MRKLSVSPWLFGVPLIDKLDCRYFGKDSTLCRFLVTLLSGSFLWLKIPRYITRLRSPPERALTSCGYHSSAMNSISVAKLLFLIYMVTKDSPIWAESQMPIRPLRRNIFHFFRSACTASSSLPVGLKSMETPYM